MKYDCDDYCCNYGCNQGRNCVARTTYEKSPVSWKDVVAAIVIGGLLGFLLTQGWMLK